MRKYEAERVLEEMLGADSLGVTASMSDEQIEALHIAYRALLRPESMICGYCQRFEEEGTDGDGWCKECDRKTHCDNPACSSYEMHRYEK